MERAPIKDRIEANLKRAKRASYTGADLDWTIAWLDRGRSRFETDIRNHHERFLELIETLEPLVAGIDTTSRAKFYRNAGQYAEAAATDNVARDEDALDPLERSDRYVTSALEAQPKRDERDAFYASITEGLLSRVSAERALVLGSFTHEAIHPGALSFIKYVTSATPYEPMVERSRAHLENARALHERSGPEYRDYARYLERLEHRIEELF